MSARAAMPVRDALEILRAVRSPSDVVITSMGSAREWMAMGPLEPLDFVFVPSSMGEAPSLGLGLALAQPERRVFACNGDGSMLMNLGALVTIASEAPPNLVLIVFDNGVYEVTGAQPTPGTGVDFAAVARACGIASVFRFSALEQWRAGAADALRARGPAVIVLDVAPVPNAGGPKSPGPTAGRARAFATALKAGCLALLFLVGPTLRPQAPGVTPATYEVVVTPDVMIAARDGVKLATDVYRPARNGAAITDRLPVLLHRTPYGKSGMTKDAQYFAAHGYVVAVQDIRGRYKSGGKFEKYDDHDATDGYDVIQWLAGQTYANGAVGMWGTSYAAHTQADPAKLNPPALKTLVINMGGMSNAWDHSVRYRGAFEMGRQLTWAWQEADRDATSPVVKAALAKEKVTDWYAAQPFRKGLNPLAVAPEYEAYYLDEQVHAKYDAYWKRLGMNWEEYYGATSDIPMIHIGGWYDIYTAGTFKNFTELRKLKKAPQRLLIGPWTHHGNTRPYAGDVSFGPNGAIADFDGDWHLRWFDLFLKGRSTGVENGAPVRLFVMGTGDGHQDADKRLFHGGYWRDAREWPIAGTKFAPYYFHDDGTLSPEKPRAVSSSTTYTFDPRNPVPSIGGGISARLGDGGYDQREDPRFPPSKAPWLPLKARADVLVYQTEPLITDVEIIGPIVVTLYAASSAFDTDFTAKLVDVYPPSADYPEGFDLNLTDAIVRARYRATRDHEQLLVPGKVYEYTIEPFPTANVFKKGHRIRVDISSSNFPRFDVNPNTGEPLGRNRRSISANNTVHHSATYPSRIVLPLAPAIPR
jgi:uncharacterized protein